MADSRYTAPSLTKRLSREIPAYMAMRLRNRLAGPVVLPRADGIRRVVLFPGLTAGPSSMRRLAISLKQAGCETYDWGLGRNLGFREEMLDFLDQRVRKLSADGVKLTLIGWSLGGLIARELAKSNKSRIEHVITLGSPFSGDIMRNNNAVKTYELLAGHSPDAVPITVNLNEKPPVWTTAIWSARDGVVAPGAACGTEAESDIRIEVACAHMSYASCPRVIRTVGAVMGHAPLRATNNQSASPTMAVPLTA